MSWEYNDETAEKIWHTSEFTKSVCLNRIESVIEEHDLDDDVADYLMGIIDYAVAAEVVNALAETAATPPEQGESK